MLVSDDLAREAWGLVFQLGMANRARLLEALQELDLTFMQAHALRLLGDEGSLTMGELADRLHCDASNVTGIIDRLETRGLVERRSSPGDRRVKALALTGTGLDLRDEVKSRITEPPEAIRRLSVADQRALRDIARRAVDG